MHLRRRSRQRNPQLIRTIPLRNSESLATLGFTLLQSEAQVTKLVTLLFAFLVPLAPTAAIADIAAIHKSALPQETAVLAAFDDLMQLEPLSLYFTGPALWQFDIPRQQVADRLDKDLALLVQASRAHPENAELALLAALAANYAHNLELPHAYETSMELLNSAEKIAPADLRPAWFRATLQCQSLEIEQGAKGFLALEAKQPPDRFPPAFWDDYMECALLSAMPEHAIRAAAYVQKENAPQSDRGKSYLDSARKRFDPYDPGGVYKSNQVWLAETETSDPVLNGDTFGVQIKVRSKWDVDGFSLKGDKGVTVFSTGPYPAKKGSMHPSILLLVQQAKPGQTLEEFASTFQRNASSVPYTPSRCPAQRCIASRSVGTGMYKANGDGLGFLVFFEREQPEFPGLLFEAPTPLPHTDESKGPQAFVFGQTKQRMPGKLFYMVLLDTAASIEDPAMKDFDFFLANLVAE